MLYEAVGLGNHCRFEKNDWFHQLQAFHNGNTTFRKKMKHFSSKNDFEMKSK